MLHQWPAAPQVKPSYETVVSLSPSRLHLEPERKRRRERRQLHGILGIAMQSMAAMALLALFGINESYVPADASSALDALIATTMPAGPRARCMP